MKLRRTLRYYGLKRPRVRQSWNKYNLYNLSRLSPRDSSLNTSKTFFQQKWHAKALARGYHGEHIKEREWERMFSRRLNSVVDMDPRYMAEFDGSEQAAGRGSGLQLVDPAALENAGEGHAAADLDGSLDSRDARARRRARVGNVKSTKMTPYMQMTFAPMERRLDIAIFRSLFASSARQARQFCVHGAVKVNGKLMNHPGYLLNPGDMFQVDTDRVLYATGAKKPRQNLAQATQADKTEEVAEETTEKEVEAEAEVEAAAEDGAESAASPAAEASEVVDEAVAAKKKEISAIKSLLTQAKAILGEPGAGHNVKRKQALRNFMKEARSAMSKAGKASSNPSDSSRVGDLTDILGKLTLDASSAAAEKAAADADAAPASVEQLTKEERARFEELLHEYAENPYDPHKPYATPWRPRPFMAPFAFIPRYLEVNQNICAAVYVRHPVARPGQSEVPTPFSPTINQLAHNWYLRRR